MTCIDKDNTIINTNELHNYNNNHDDDQDGQLMVMIRFPV